MFQNFQYCLNIKLSIVSLSGLLYICKFSIFLFFIINSIQCKTDWKYLYTNWESVPVNDTTLWTYVPSVENLLNNNNQTEKNDDNNNNNIKHKIDHFVQAYTNGFSIFHYKVSFVMKSPLTSSLDESDNNNNNNNQSNNTKWQNCLAKFDVNPWGKNFTIMQLDCSLDRDLKQVDLMEALPDDYTESLTFY